MIIVRFYEYRLLDNVEKAREMVQDLGMAALVTGETIDLTDMGAGVCRLVNLGTNHPEHFVREQSFAIAEDGSIYVYDPVDDIWRCYSP